MGKLFIAAGVVGTLIAPAALAQSAPQNSNAGLEDIVVTAQKRAQSLQSVPVSVTAIGAEEIANQRLVEFADITRGSFADDLAEREFHQQFGHPTRDRHVRLFHRRRAERSDHHR